MTKQQLTLLQSPLPILIGIKGQPELLVHLGVIKEGGNNPFLFYFID